MSNLIVEKVKNGFEGYNVPERIRKASEKICNQFNINGICDPMYIANVIAFESGSGDGCGAFTRGTIENSEKIARRLIGSYGCNISMDKFKELVDILEEEKFAIKFIDPVSEQVHTIYYSFISKYELAETCDLIMSEKGLDKIRIDITEDMEIKLQYMKYQGKDLKMIWKIDSLK